MFKIISMTCRTQRERPVHRCIRTDLHGFFRMFGIQTEVENLRIMTESMWILGNPIVFCFWVARRARVVLC